MRIVIATGIFPPEPGGPSYYAQAIAHAFTKDGHTVRVVTYGALKKLPSGVRHIAYLLRLLPALFGADAVIALDTFSVALPAAILCRILRVPLIVRTGGDFLWEQYLERTHDLVPLPHFYAKHQPFTRKERVIFRLTRFALARAMVVFSTQMQQDVWRTPYGIVPERMRIIGNAVDAPLAPERPIAKNFLWYVRPIAMKNGPLLHRAFVRAQAVHPEIILEEGMLQKAALMERMKSCYAVILPSITEISPNYILDALRFKKPFILDKYSGFAQWLAPYGILVDPLDEDDVVRAIETLADPAGYEAAQKRAASFSFVRSYDDVARDFIALIGELKLKSGLLPK